MAAASGVFLILLCSCSAEFFQTQASEIPVTPAPQNRIYAGPFNTCVHKGDDVFCWGVNGNYGQLALGSIESSLGDETKDRNTSTNLNLAIGIKQIKSVAFGLRTACATGADGTIKCWGRTNEASLVQLGLVNFDIFSIGYKVDLIRENMPSVILLENKVPIQIVMNSLHNICVLTVDHIVKCIGYDRSGILGMGKIQDYSRASEIKTIDLGLDTETFVTSISLGRSHACALTNKGTVKCWGGTEFNQAPGKGVLGNGTDRNSGDHPDEMGQNLPFMQLGTGEKAVQVVASFYRTCVVLASQKVKCVGSVNGYGDINSRGFSPETSGDQLEYINLGSTFKVAKIVSGNYHDCALSIDGKVKCWGSGGFGTGVLGIYIDGEKIGDEPEEMGDNLPIVDLGFNEKIIDIAAGGEHNCVLFESLKIKCWGDNRFGMLGVGDKISRGINLSEMGESLPFVIFPFDK